MTSSLTALAGHLVDVGVERVVMEATSDYWRPAFYLFEAHGLDPWLVNSRDVKHLPGRPKTDVLDAVWLCKVAERQMLRPSFVPPVEIRQLRDLTRYRTDLVNARTAEKNRVEKLLEDACIKLSVVATDIFGVSGRAMMAALIKGERDPKALAEMARAALRKKLPMLEEAFTGRFDAHHAFLLNRMLGRVDAINAAYPVPPLENVDANFQAMAAATTDFVATCDGQGAAVSANISLYNSNSQSFSDSETLPPQGSGYIVLMLQVPTGWKELQVTYMPTFAPDKTLTFTMKAADVIRG